MSDWHKTGIRRGAAFLGAAIVMLVVSFAVRAHQATMFLFQGWALLFGIFATLYLSETIVTK